MRLITQNLTVNIYFDSFGKTLFGCIFLKQPWTTGKYVKYCAGYPYSNVLQKPIETEKPCGTSCI